MSEDLRIRERFLLRRDRAVQAGAGTGKTHALVTQYLHLCAGLTAHDGPIEPRAILAMTFTEKAAGEMMERLRRRVRLLCQAAAQGDDAVAALESELWASASDLGRALPGAAHFEKILGQLGSAPVATFHAFAGNLLRKHAALCGLEPDFALLDEESARELQLDVAERVVLQALDGELAATRSASGVTVSAEQAASLLSEYGFRAPGEGAALVELLCTVCARRAEEGRAPAGLASSYAAETMASALAMLSGRFLAALCQVGALSGALGARGAEQTRALAAGALGLQPLFASLEMLPQAAARSAELIGGLKNLRARSGDESSREKIAELKQIMRSTLTALQALSRTSEAAPLARTFERLCVVTSLAYGEAKQDQGSVDFTDLLVKARDLLRDHPGERERVKGRYAAVLVDEFQDTNPLQAELLELLVGQPGIHQPGRLYIVGDRKQSIYEFRGADVATFARWCERIVAAGGDEEHLLISRRSQPGVLRLVNALFSQVMNPSPPTLLTPGTRMSTDAEGWPGWMVRWQPQRDRLQALRVDEGAGPWAELLTSSASAAADLPGVAEQEDEESEPAHETVSKDSFAVEAELCAQQILSLHRDGRPFSDVVILLRRFTHLSRYLHALRRAHIPHYVVKGRGFFDAAEIRDANAVFTLLDDPDDVYSLVTVLRSPFCGLSDESLARLHLAGRLRLPALLDIIEGGASGLDVLPRDEADRLRHMLSWFAILLHHGERLGPTRALRLLLDESDLLVILAAGEGGAQRIANLDMLLGRARSYEAAGGGLRGFIRWLRSQCDPALSSLLQGGEAAQAQLVDEHGDVVRVMTIHQAKGLEFPIVLIPGCQGRERVDAGPISYDSDVGLGLVLRRDGDRIETLPSLQVRALRHLRTEAESARLFYVAATRARDRVIFIGEGRHEKSRAGTWRTHLDALLDSSAGHLLKEVDPRPSSGASASAEDRLTGQDIEAAGPAVEAVALEPALRKGYGTSPPLMSPLRQGPPLRLLGAAAADLLACPRRYHLRHGLSLPERVNSALFSGRSTASGLDGGESLVRVQAAEEDHDATRRELVAHGTLAHRLLGLVDFGAGGADLDAILAADGYDAMIPAVAEIRTRVARVMRSRLFQEFAARQPEPRSALLRAVPYALRLPNVETEKDDTHPSMILEGQLDLLWITPAGGGGLSATVLDYHYSYQPPLPEGALVQARRGLLGLVARAAMEAMSRETPPRPHQEELPVRVGISYLREPDPTPRLTVSHVMDEQILVKRLLELGLHAQQPAATYVKLPLLPSSSCVALGCGYLDRCHGLGRRGDERETSDRDEVGPRYPDVGAVPRRSA